jgi:hypothetical protein
VDLEEDRGDPHLEPVTEDENDSSEAKGGSEDDDELTSFEL